MWDTGFTRTWLFTGAIETMWHCFFPSSVQTITINHHADEHPLCPTRASEDCWGGQFFLNFNHVPYHSIAFYEVNPVLSGLALRETETRWKEIGDKCSWSPVRADSSDGKGWDSADANTCTTRHARRVVQVSVVQDCKTLVSQGHDSHPLNRNTSLKLYIFRKWITIWLWLYKI